MNTILTERFNEVKDIIPFDVIFKKRDRESMLGEILTWCRDYFNGPKDSHLAYMLLGYWFATKETEKRNKKSNN